MSDPTATPEQPTGQPEGTDGLQQRAEKAELERDQYLALLKSTRADFENYQKRVLRDQATERKYAYTSFAGDLIPLLDNLNRAIEAAKKAGDNSPLSQGVAMVQAMFLDVLRRHGITPIEAKGQPFDPNVHQAVVKQPTTTVPANTVVEAIEQGFRIHDRVLRPAQVIVAVAPE